jgi:hypothetical protein
MGEPITKKESAGGAAQSAFPLQAVQFARADVKMGEV